MQEKDKPEGRPGGAAGEDHRVMNPFSELKKGPAMTIGVCHDLPHG